jgi:hypothetical protein
LQARLQARSTPQGYRLQARLQARAFDVTVREGITTR